MVKLKIHRKRSCKSWLPRLQEVINAPPLRAREWHDPDMQPVKHREVTKNINPHIRSPRMMEWMEVCARGGIRRGQGVGEERCGEGL